MNIRRSHETVIEITMPEKEAEELFRELEKLEFTRGSCPKLHTIFIELYKSNRSL